MEKKPTSFTYNGETVIIVPGNYLQKNELINRLNEMSFTSINSSYSKDILITIYEALLNLDKNKILIFNKLKKDTKYYISKNDSQRNEFIENPKKINIFAPRKYTASGEPDANSNNNNDDNDSMISAMSSSESSSFCRKILSFLNNHKIDIIEKCIYILLIFGFDAFLKNFAQKHFIIGKILNYFRSVVTPKRMILGLLVYYIIKYILDMLLYYLFGFGILTLLFVMFKDKIKDFIFNVL